MKPLLYSFSAIAVLSYTWFSWGHTPQPIPTTTQTIRIDLVPTPRRDFTPTTTTRGYWNIDIVDDFTLPPSKSLTFCGAGRNLHVRDDWSKLFRRGFSSIDLTRMTTDEKNTPETPKSKRWKSRLSQSQRALWVGAAYLANPPFNLAWARNSELADATLYQSNQTYNSLAAPMAALGGGCDIFRDCPEGQRPLSTFSKIYFDIENDGISYFKQQEQANLYVWMMQVLRYYVSPQTEIGSISPLPLNDFGYSRASAYRSKPEWLWRTHAAHTNTSKQRGMTDEILGKTFEQVVDFQMPGTYYVYPDFDYTIGHTDDASRHWLASLLGEQEVNARLSNKKRISWQWLFNTQSGAFANSGRSEHPAPPAVAEGMGIFYWFTGAYGTILWDDAVDLTPNRRPETDPNRQGIGSDRHYQCYEHYLHGLWRLFKHHADMFDGTEKYLNDQTECSYDGGKTWWRYNANQLKTKNLPFARGIVRGNQLLVVATKPYARPNEKSRFRFRYTQDGYASETEVVLNGDEIFLGRGELRK